MTWRHAIRPHRAYWLTCRSAPCARRLVILRCGDRTCPECRAKDYYRLRDKYQAALKEIHRPKLITLTLVNQPELTREGVAHLRKCLKALFVRFEDIIRGGLYAIEVTNKGRGWHLHVHVLADADFIPQEELSRAWRAITGDSFVVDVQAAASPDKAFRYLLKYLTKKPDFGQGETGDRDVVTAEELVRQQFNNALKGVRLIHAFGSLYAYKPVRVSRPCPTCGSSDWLLISILTDWPADIFDTGPDADEEDA